MHAMLADELSARARGPVGVVVAQYIAWRGAKGARGRGRLVVLAS